MKKDKAVDQIEAALADLNEELGLLADAAKAYTRSSTFDGCSFNFEKDAPSDCPVRHFTKFKDETIEATKACLGQLEQREKDIYGKLDKKLVSQVNKKHKAAAKIEKNKVKPRRNGNKALIKMQTLAAALAKWQESHLKKYSSLAPTKKKTVCHSSYL